MFLRIESISVSADAGLTFTAAVGRQYGLERAADVANGPWVRVATAVPDSDGVITLSDPSPAPPASFYRIVAEFP